VIYGAVNFRGSIGEVTKKPLNAGQGHHKDELNLIQGTSLTIRTRVLIEIPVCDGIIAA